MATITLLFTASAAHALPLQIVPTTLSSGTAGVPYNNIVQSVSGTAPITWTLASGGLPVGIGLDPASGVFSGTANVAGTSNFIVRATDSLGDTATAPLAITIVPAAPAALTFAVSPSNVVAGVAIAPAVQVKVADAFGNGVSAQSVSLTLFGTGVLSGGGAATSDANGLVTFSALSIDLAGGKQLTAASGALPTVTSAAFTVSPAAAAALTFAVGPSDVIAGNAIAPAVQVKVTDAFGNGVPGQSVALSLVGTGVLTGGGTALSDANGLSAFASLSVNLAGSKQLTASTGALPTVTSAAFTVSPAAPVALAFAVGPSNVVAGAAIAPAVQVKVADAFGNGVPAQSVSLALVGTGVLTGGGAAASDANGLVTFSALSIDLAGLKQLTASSGALPTVTSTAFTVSPAAPVSLAFAVGPSNVFAGAAIAPAVQVKVADAFGNGVPAQSVVLSLVGTGVLTGGGAVASDANGLAIFSALSVNLVGSKQLTASSSVLSPVTSTAFTVSPAAAAALTFSVSPSNVVAGVAIAPAVQVKVADAFGNGVPAQSVALSLVGAGVLTGGGTALSDANGLSTFAALSVNLAGSKQLTASSGALPTVTSTAFTVSPAAPVALAFAVGPSNVVAGAAIAPAVQVKVADVFGNGVPAQSIALSLVGTGVLTGGGAVVSDVNGLGTFAALSVNLVGSKQLTAASGVLPTITSAAFTVSPAAAASLAFTVSPSNVVAGVAIAPAVQVKVADTFGNSVPTQSVSLALVGTGVLTGGGAVLSDAAGLATFATLSVNLAGSKLLTASSAGVPPATSVAFTVSPAAPAILTFDVQPSPAFVNAAIAPSVRVKATDAFTNVTTGTSVSLTLVGLGVLKGAAPVLTDAAGFATFPALSVDRAGAFQLSATATGITAVLSSVFTINCPVIAVLPATLPVPQFGILYSQLLTASGGTLPYTFAVTLGVLPTGLTLSPVGLLSGVPSVTGTFSFTITATSPTTGNCTGSTVYTVTVPVVPAAVTDLVATRLIATNDASGIEKIQLTFTSTLNSTAAEVYRAPFGGYPRYDDAGGLPQPTPSYPPRAPWVLTAVTTTGQTDKPPTRDVWSYVVFMKNAFGQGSGVSNKTSAIPDYALGDVSNGTTPGTGDNLVNAADVSLLGAHYGISGSAITTGGWSYLDVGPTLDFTVNTRPLTDGRIDFEDFVVFAINFGNVASPASIVATADAAGRAAKASEHLLVRAPSLVESGATFSAVLHLESAGRMQALSSELDWDPSVAQPIAMASAGWVETQEGMVLSARPGNVDAALLGVRTTGFTGSGDVATVTFRALRAGDPAIRFAKVLGRDAANRALPASALSYGAQVALPTHTLLLAPFPNPSGGPTSVPFALAQSGAVDLAIYSVDGRRVRSLQHGDMAAGSYRITWSGDDDDHRPAAPGVYYVRLVTGGRHMSRTLVHLR